MTAMAVTSGNATRSVAVSAASQLAVRFFDVLVSVTVSVLVIRHLGPSGFGDYVMVLAVSGLTGLLSEFGLQKLAVREVSRDAGDAGPVIGTVVGLRLALVVVSTLLAQVVITAFDPTPAVRWATLFGSLFFVGEALLSVTVLFHVDLAQQYEALARFGGHFVKLLLVVALVTAGGGIVGIAAATATSALVAAVIGIFLVRRRYDVAFTWDRSRVRYLMREALPLAPAAVIGVVYLRLDGVMIALLGSRREVGIYGAAYSAIEYVFLASPVLLWVLFPLLARAHGADPARFTRIYRRGAEILAAAMVPVAVVLLFVAAPLVRTAFETRFEAASGPMIVLAASLALITVNAWQGLALLSGGWQKVNLVYLLVAVVVNVLVDIPLITWLGPIGAAWGTLISATVLVLCSSWAVRRYLGERLDPVGLGRVLAANGLLAAVLGALLVIGVPWVLAAALAGLTYPIWLVLCGVVRPADLQALRNRGDALDELPEPALAGGVGGGLP